MKLSEAYAELNLSEGSTPEEAKKQYRKLSKEYHPDINKAPEAEAKIKKINEAYDCVKNGKGNERSPAPTYGHHQSNWSPFGRQQVVQLQHIELKLTIDFKEAVLGCTKEMKYSRKAKCPDCNGEGQIHLNNGCQKCGGKGQVAINQRGMVMISTCPQCQGKSSSEDCKTCSTEGLVQTDVSVHISVPAGIQDGNTLRLQGMGHYAGSVMGIMDQYTDAYCHITVIPEPGLSIEGKSVVSNLPLSLLDAIRGCSRTIKTIHGDKEIQVPPLSKNDDEVSIPRCGVAGTGDHRVLLDVQYPQDTSKLIELLSNEVV